MTGVLKTPTRIEVQIDEGYSLLNFISLIDGIVEKTEKEIGYSFSPEQVYKILTYTIRKNSVAKNGDDYIPILFENELRDYVVRLQVNTASNYIRKEFKQRKAVEV